MKRVTIIKHKSNNKIKYDDEIRNDEIRNDEMKNDEMKDFKMRKFNEDLFINSLYKIIDNIFNEKKYKLHGLYLKIWFDNAINYHQILSIYMNKKINYELLSILVEVINDIKNDFVDNDLIKNYIKNKKIKKQLLFGTLFVIHCDFNLSLDFLDKSSITIFKNEEIMENLFEIMDCIKFL